MASRRPNAIRLAASRYAGYFVHPLGFVGQNCIISIHMKKKCEDLILIDLGFYYSNSSSEIAGSLKDVR
jgi:hypothetical protein